MKLKSSTRPSVLACAALLPFYSGCFAFFPTEFLSSFILDTQISCSDLAREFELPPAPPELVPSDAGLSYESFTVTSQNGSVIQGWFLPAQFDGEIDDGPQGTVLVLHGSEGSRDCYLPWAAVAVENGFHAVLFDYQGFDDSDGTADIATLQDDANAVLDWITADSTAARQSVHLMAVSLGTGPALALARQRPQDIASIALDGTFNPLNIEAIIADTLGRFFWMLGSSIRDGFGWLLETHEHLQEITLPVLSLNGEVDRRTPVADARQVFDALGSTQKSFWIFEQAGHVRCLFLDEARYVSLVISLWRHPDQPPDPKLHVRDGTVHLPVFELPSP